MPRETITREQWEEWQPTLMSWYKTRTADSIAEQLRNEHSLNVTPKMLRDRFKTWNALPKYNRRQPAQPRRRKQAARSLVDPNVVQFTVFVNSQVQMRQEPLQHTGAESNAYIPQPWTAAQLSSLDTCISGLQATHHGSDRTRSQVLLNVGNPLLSPKPSRAPDTPKEDWHLQRTLNEVQGYLDHIVEQGSWIFRDEQPAFELQKLAANAHMAISSQSYDCHAIWKELDGLYSPVSKTMPHFDENNLLTMHPRELTVLLRLLVDSLYIDLWASHTLENVKYMFWMVTSQTLQAAHPVRLLCGMPKRKTKELLFRLLELMDVRLFAKVSDQQPDGAVFVAQEQTYAARVLSSLGYTKWAEFKLQTIISDLDTNMDPFTKADAFRTLGYMYECSCTNMANDSTTILQKSKTASTSALDLFLGINKGVSNEVMFTRISLAQISRKLNDLASAETHLAEAIEIWQKTRRSEDQGGSKLILDLHQVLVDQSKFEEARELRQLHQRYFEESRVYYEDQGS